MSFSLNQQFEELVKTNLTEKQMITDNNNTDNTVEIIVMDESPKSPDFFQDNKSVKNAGGKYTKTGIKSRNFQSNISYVGTKKEDPYNENVIYDIYLLITNNQNPFLLDRKLSKQNKHEMIYMITKECMPANFYKHFF